MPVSTGEHTQNRVVFKQLLQAGAVDLIQIDAARVGGVNENLAILLLAAKFNVRVFPHAGGVGLCELVQHLAMADFVAITGQMEDRAIEFVDHLHQHFLDPVRIRHGRYLAPDVPGFSAEMHAASIAEFSYPNGRFWVEDLAAAKRNPASYILQGADRIPCRSGFSRDGLSRLPDRDWSRFYPANRT